MADRQFRPGPQTLQTDSIILWANMTVGASGAVSASTAGNGQGVTSIVRNSAGKYTITLSDAYPDFLYADAKVLSSTLGNPTTAGILMSVFSQAVATVAAPTIVVQFQKTSDGTAVDPASGAVVYFELKLKNSSVY